MRIDADFKSEIGNQNSQIVSPCLRGGRDVSEHTLKFPVPMLDVRVFLKLLQLELRARPPQAPVTKIWLRAEPARPRSTQGGLFLPEAPEPEKLEVTLAKIGSSVHRPIGASESAGADELRVGVAEVIDTHRPDAFRMKRFSSQQPATGIRQKQNPPRRHGGTEKISSSGHRFIGSSGGPAESDSRGACLALRRFRPPMQASVRVEGGRPVGLTANDEAGEEHRGAIVWASGPWRTSGEWWNEQQWSRDVWDVAVAGETVTVYRIYCERGVWWVEGTYD
jgi:protein ImuB